MMADPKLRVFVSYETTGGKDLATEAFVTFRQLGVAAWVWHLHKTSGGYLHTEIADRIGDADFVLFLCTSGTSDSPGQRFEMNNALSREKSVWAMTMDRRYVPAVLAGFVQDVTPLELFSATCKHLIDQWEQGFPAWPSVEKSASVMAETASVQL
jgi:hypothetical protein